MFGGIHEKPNRHPGVDMCCSSTCLRPLLSQRTLDLTLSYPTPRVGKPQTRRWVYLHGLTPVIEAAGKVFQVPIKNGRPVPGWNISCNFLPKRYHGQGLYTSTQAKGPGITVTLHLHPRASGLVSKVGWRGSASWEGWDAGSGLKGFEWLVASCWGRVFGLRRCLAESSFYCSTSVQLYRWIKRSLFCLTTLCTCFNELKEKYH